MPRYPHFGCPRPVRYQITNFFKQSFRLFELSKGHQRTHSFALRTTDVQPVDRLSKTWYFLKALYFSFKKIPSTNVYQVRLRNGNSCKECSSLCTPPFERGTAVHHLLQSSAAPLSAFQTFRTIARYKGSFSGVVPVPNLCTYPSRFGSYRGWSGHVHAEELI